jgi:hypothetical protein
VPFVDPFVPKVSIAARRMSLRLRSVSGRVPVPVPLLAISVAPAVLVAAELTSE